MRLPDSLIATIVRRKCIWSNNTRPRAFSLHDVPVSIQQEITKVFTPENNDEEVVIISHISTKEWMLLTTRRLIVSTSDGVTAMRWEDIRDIDVDMSLDDPRGYMNIKSWIDEFWVSDSKGNRVRIHTQPGPPLLEALGAVHCARQMAPKKPS